MTKAPKLPIMPSLLRLTVNTGLIVYWAVTDSPNALFVYSALAWIWLTLALIVVIAVREVAVLKGLREKGWYQYGSRPWLARVDWTCVLLAAFLLLWHFHLWVALATILTSVILTAKSNWISEIEKRVKQA